MGENIPVDIRDGSVQWEFTLEELIPAGSVMSDSDDAVFRLGVECDAEKENFRNCRWTSIRREFTSQGLRRIRTGIGIRIQEAANE